MIPQGPVEVTFSHQFWDFSSDKHYKFDTTDWHLLEALPTRIELEYCIKSSWFQNGLPDDDYLLASKSDASFSKERQVETDLYLGLSCIELLSWDVSSPTCSNIFWPIGLHVLHLSIPASVLVPATWRPSKVPYLSTTISSYPQLNWKSTMGFPHPVLRILRRL